jgi:hypothetical protein
MLKYLQFGGAAIALALAVSILFAWRAARDEQQKLQTELKTTQKALTEANERQKARDETLTGQLRKLTEEKAAVRTPAEALKALPGVLPLPAPIVLRDESGAATDGVGAQSHRRSGQARVSVPPGLGPSMEISAQTNALPGVMAEPKIEMPAVDLKPLYDFAVDCRACQTELAAVQADLKDEQAKTVALGRERDDALHMARGGSVVRRIVRAAKWFAIGAAVGAVAIKFAR